MTAIDAIIVIFCAYRLTQLVVYDTVSTPITDWLSRLHPKLEEFLCCPHCVGFWASVLTVGVRIGANYVPWLSYLILAFGIAGAVSIIEHATEWLAPQFKPPQLPSVLGEVPTIVQGVKGGKVSSADAVVEAVERMGMTVRTVQHPTKGTYHTISKEE